MTLRNYEHVVSVWIPFKSAGTFLNVVILSKRHGGSASIMTVVWIGRCWSERGKDWMVVSVATGLQKRQQLNVVVCNV